MSNKMNNKTLLWVLLGLGVVYAISRYFNSVKNERTFKTELIAIDTDKVTSILLYPKAEKGFFKFWEFMVITIPCFSIVTNRFSQRFKIYGIMQYKQLVESLFSPRMVSQVPFHHFPKIFRKK